MYRFLRSSVQSKAVRTGLDIVFSTLVIISVLTLLVLTDFWVGDKEFIRIYTVLPLNLFFFGAVFYNHLRSYFPKAEGAERLQVIFEHILYYPACAFLFVYIVMGFLHCFIYIAYPEVWDNNVCRKTGICKEGLSFNDRGKHEYSITKEWCRDHGVWIEEKRSCNIWAKKEKQP